MPRSTRSTTAGATVGSGDLLNAAPAITRLPLAKWARRFGNGTVSIAGEMRACRRIIVSDEVVLEIAPGTCHLEFAFEGGDTARILSVRIVTEEVRLAGVHDGATVVVANESGLRLGAVSVDTPVVLVSLVHQLIDRMDDIVVGANATPNTSIILTLLPGVTLDLPAGSVLRIRGETEGPSSQLRLSAPLQVQFGGSGIELAHQQFRRLSRLASVRISAATLHPDGEVQLEADAAPVLRRALRGGLETASARFSRLVRHSPHFRGVRTFLKVPSP